MNIARVIRELWRKNSSEYTVYSWDQVPIRKLVRYRNVQGADLYTIKYKEGEPIGYATDNDSSKSLETIVSRIHTGKLLGARTEPHLDNKPRSQAFNILPVEVEWPTTHQTPQPTGVADEQADQGPLWSTEI